MLPEAFAKSPMQVLVCGINAEHIPAAAFAVGGVDTAADLLCKQLRHCSGNLN